MIQDCEKGTCIEENKRKECPYWAELFPCTFVILLDILVCKYYIDTQQVEWKFPIFSYGFAVLCHADPDSEFSDFAIKNSINRARITMDFKNFLFLFIHFLLHTINQNSIKFQMDL